MEVLTILLTLKMLVYEIGIIENKFKDDIILNFIIALEMPLPTEAKHSSETHS